MIRSVPEPRCFESQLARLAQADAVRRAWRGDYTLWGASPKEIVDRLGWLRLPQAMAEQVGPLRGFARSVEGDGIDTVALLGMGGSSLAPETLARTLGPPGLRFAVLDTTHPASVRRAIDSFPPARTLFIVSTKSGTTSETLALFYAFYRNAATVLGKHEAGQHFVAITDPESPLVGLAEEHRFRRVFLNDPNVGGRYAALSLVGLVPAALLGLDLNVLLESATDMAARCAPSVPVERNPAAVLAALLAAHADDGRDKVTLVLPDALAGFGAWLEQLLAESTGKGGKGIVPIVGEPLGATELYGTDRVFVRFGAVANTPPPVVEMEPSSPDGLGGQFFLWEFATALLGHLLALNPFDQPDVESAKSVTRAMLSAFRDRGERPSAATVPPTLDAVRRLTAQAVPGDYIAVLAYLDPRPDVEAEMTAVRLALRKATRCATTLGYGPRFLHSTGQLHKGGSERGLFLEVIDDAGSDVAIPDGSKRPVTFGLLIRAQAFGDAAALAARGRRLAVVDLGRGSLASLRAAVERLET